MAKKPKKNVTDKTVDPKAHNAPKTSTASAKTKAAKPAAPMKAAASGSARTAKTAKTAKTADESAVKKASAPGKAPAKAVSRPASTQRRKSAAAAVTPEQRYRMIQDAAYFIAERNGFVGDNHAYWLEAERAIDAELAAR